MTQRPLDTILLVGDRQASRTVKEEKNKTFLTLRGQPLLIHILKALEYCPEVGTIYPVGPRDKLCQVIADSELAARLNKTIYPIEQGDDILENLRRGITASLPEEFQNHDFTELRETAFRQKPFLFLPGDIPLVTAREISQFIQRSDLGQNDYYIGITTEEHLRPFYP